MLSPSEWTFKHEDCTLHYKAERKYQKYILERIVKVKQKLAIFNLVLEHFQVGERRMNPNQSSSSITSSIT